MDYPTTHFASESMAWASLLLIAVTCVFSFFGFGDPRFEEKYIFCPRAVLGGKEYFRLLTSGFLHADARHLIFNMISLYLFGTAIEFSFGVVNFLLIYFASILGGSLLSLWLHRHHEYRAYGASGGVCGIIFAHIMFFPGGGIQAFFIPISIPTWAYAIGFLLISFFALKNKVDNVGHDAHIGGAIIGLLSAAALHPYVVQESPKLFVTLIVISTAMLIYFVKNPMFLSLSSFSGSFSGANRREKQRSPQDTAREVDRILEKIAKHGLNSLKEEERRLLNQTSDKLKSRATSRGRESDLVI